MIHYCEPYDEYYGIQCFGLQFECGHTYCLADPELKNHYKLHRADQVSNFLYSLIMMATIIMVILSIRGII